MVQITLHLPCNYLPFVETLPLAKHSHVHCLWAHIIRSGHGPVTHWFLNTSLRTDLIHDEAFMGPYVTEKFRDRSSFKEASGDLEDDNSTGFSLHPSNWPLSVVASVSVTLSASPNYTNYPAISAGREFSKNSNRNDKTGVKDETAPLQKHKVLGRSCSTKGQAQCI